MSHSVVLIFGCENDEELNIALAPYEESDPKDTKFVEFNDCTDEVLKDWNENQSKNYKTFKEYLNDYGYIKQNDKYGYMINTKAKWDWYQIGGRWSGYFKVKDKNAGEYIPAAWNHAEVKKGYLDHCQIKDIDFDGMLQAARVTTLKLYAAYKEAKGDTTPVAWAQFRDDVGENKTYPKMDNARKAYQNTPYAQALAKARNNDLLPRYFISDDYIDFCEGTDTPEENMIQDAVNTVITPFACLKENTWYEKGNMGWWGCITNKKEQSNWDCEFLEILKSLPEDTWVTAVDCHI